jgi:hypothetical protein
MIQNVTADLKALLTGKLALFSVAMPELWDIAALESQMEGLPPFFGHASDARSYLNLKIAQYHRRLSLENRGTRILHSTFNGASTPALTVQRGTATLPNNGLVCFDAPQLDKELLVQLREELVLGRQTEESVKPDVDFSLWAGFEAGVSRRHARLRRSDSDRLELTDLGSANGTYLNGKRLNPNEPVLLHNGDEISLGGLRLFVWFYGLEG